MRSTQHIIIDGPPATSRARTASGPSPIWRTLSLFTGFGGLDRAFSETGRFSVVSAGDLIWGHDIAGFDGRGFQGAIDLLLAGVPCQKWSSANRTDRAKADEIDAGPYSTHAGVVALRNLWRVIDEVRPRCVLVECVPGVPTIHHPAYGHYQRLDLRDSECGGTTRRLRHWQWLSLGPEPRWLRPERRPERKATEPAALATLKGQFDRSRWDEHVRRQGFDGLLGGMPDLSAFTLSARWKLVGNAVPLTMGRVMAAAVIAALSDNDSAERPSMSRDCKCGCGRVFEGRGQFAGKACAKRNERREKNRGGS